MYSAVLSVHSWLRWVVLILAVLVVVRAVMGRSRQTPWTAADEHAGKWFVASLDLQMLLGLLLYVALSPATAEAFNDFGAAMRISPLRFWAVEHLVGMVIAVALAHIGRVRVRRATDPKARHTTALVFTAISLVVMVLSIPWPGFPNGRPLFRF
jgi:hypothetical protein